MTVCVGLCDKGLFFVCRYAFGTGVVDYNPSVSRSRRSGSSTASTGSSRAARDARVEEEVAAAREEARQATQTVERLTNMTAYMASYLQVLCLSKHASIWIVYL